jgi:acetyltransferase-like isoleucine patch superfamily enzyme
VIGDNVKIQNNVSIYTRVILEDDVFCGPSMVFTNVVTPPRSHVSRKHEDQRTIVKRGATFGANSTIVCGHDTGRYAFVGAGGGYTQRCRLRPCGRQPGSDHGLDVPVRDQVRIGRYVSCEHTLHRVRNRLL